VGEVNVRLITRDRAVREINFDDKHINHQCDLVLPMAPAIDIPAVLVPTLTDSSILMEDGELIDGIKFHHRRYRFQRYETIAVYEEV
jgi:hypothetical protein